ANISECVEEHVLSLRDEETLDLVKPHSIIKPPHFVRSPGSCPFLVGDKPQLASVGQDTMTEERKAQYVAQLCEHCNSKKAAGKVLNGFIKVLPLEDAVSLVHDVRPKTSLLSVATVLRMT